MDKILSDGTVLEKAKFWRTTCKECGCELEKSIIMKIRIYTNGKHFKIKRKRWFGWEWLDQTGAWCNWYGKNKPQIFHSLEEVFEFISDQEWELITSDNINEYLNDEESTHEAE